MIGLLIITHETLGQAYAQLAAHFFGDLPENVRIVGVLAQEMPEQITERAAAVLTQLQSAYQGVLLLTDIFGATPCNTAQKLIHDDKTVMVTGLNAPMMVKAMQYATQAEHAHTLALSVRDAAVNGIMVLDNQHRGGAC